MNGLIQPPIILRQGHAAGANPNIQYGLQPQNVDVRAYARQAGGVSAGDVGMFDMAQSDDDVSNATIGDDASCWRNLILPATAGMEGGYPLAVALETIAINTEGWWRVFGIVTAQMDGGGAPTIGDDLFPTNGSGDLSVTAQLGDRAVAIALSAADPASVWFFGIGAMGVPNVGT